jgi:Flp pilus assembly secretin CpaC
MTLHHKGPVMLAEPSALARSAQVAAILRY